MSIYLDSANLNEVKQASQLKWVAGITTNPTILAAAGLPAEDLLAEINALGFDLVFYQVRTGSLESMLAEAEKAQKILGEKLVVKVSPTPQGFDFAANHSGNIKVCITAVFSPAQALLAREVKAALVAVYLNRATRLLGDGLALSREISKVLLGSGTKILAASLKSVDEVSAAVLNGADHVTMPLNVVRMLPNHYLSQEAEREFAATGVYLND
ncbi:MAG: transaldolase family protein [Chloroflexota bacterium]